MRSDSSPPPATDTQRPVESRRSALRRTAATAAALIGPAAIASAQDSRRRPSRRPRLPELYPGGNARNFQEIRDNENDHVGFITSFLGTRARPKPVFRNLERSNEVEFARVALLFENNAGTRGVLTSAPAVFSQDVLMVAVALNQIEARHASFLNSVVNLPLSLGDASFEPPIALSEVAALFSLFIANLNGGPPLTFSLTNPSPENDVAIFNFFLAGEYLETEFYNINVPKFFTDR